MESKESSSGIKGVFILYDPIPLGFIVLSTGTYCSLACKDCGNFIPYISKNNRSHYSHEEIEKDIRKLFCHLKLKYIQIQGGEALLHPNLDKIIESVYKHGKSKGKVDDIVLATSGKILKIDPDLLRLLKEMDIKIRISDYSNAEVVRNYFEEQLKIRNIRYSVYRFLSKTSEWFDMGGVNRKPDSNDNLVQARFERCGFNKCYTLENGLLGKCSRSVVAQYVQGFKPASDDYINVRELDRKELGKKLGEYVNNRKFMTSCRACNGTDGEKIPAAIQIKT